MKYDKISLDTLFSVWIWIWAIIFIVASFIGTKLPWNPAASLVLAISYQILTFFIVIAIPTPHLLNVLMKSFLITIVKVTPLYLIFTSDINWKTSILHGTALFAVYCAYIYLKGFTLEGIYTNFTEIIIKDQLLERVVLYG